MTDVVLPALTRDEHLDLLNRARAADIDQVASRWPYRFLRRCQLA
jgi:hypothetical protein